MIDKIDLIISTRNRIQDLIYTLEWALRVGFLQEQIFVIDDASMDATFQVLKNKFPDIWLHRNENAQGYIPNRNQMMFNTIRPFILSLDDDSHVRTREEIEEAILLLDSRPEYGIFAFHVFEQLENPPSREELPKEVREVRSYIGCGHIIKREVIKTLGLYREEFEFYCEELDYSIRAFQAGYKVITKDDLVVHHRVDWEERQKQIASDLSKGIYGAVWRSKLGFSNNLIVTMLYYPVVFDSFFFFYYTIIRAKNFLFQKWDFKGFFGGLARFFSFIPYILKEKDKLSLGLFLQWIKLPSR